MILPEKLEHLDQSDRNHDILELFGVPGGPDYTYVNETSYVVLGEGERKQRAGSASFTSCVGLLLQSDEKILVAHVVPGADSAWQIPLDDFDQAVIMHGRRKVVATELAELLIVRGFKGSVVQVEVQTCPPMFDMYVDAGSRQLGTVSRNTCRAPELRVWYSIA